MKTLIKNGTIYDGTGNKPYIGDVLIEDDKIIEVCEKIEEKADEIIDAQGLSVCPGLIDAHSHNDFFVDHENAEKFFEPFIRQGVTTQITGNCSFSNFGFDKDTPHKDKIGGGLFQCLNPGSFKDFVERNKNDLYVNIVPLVGNGSVRAGMTGYDNTPYTKQQIDQLLSHVEEAMENGAFGGSFGFMYEPNRYSKMDELYAFAAKIKEYDGIVTVHPRANSIVSADYPLFTKKSHLELGLDEVVDIMKKTGCRMEYSHLILVGSRSWKVLDKMLKTFYDARKQGYDIAYDNYVFHYGASVITVVFPEWYAALSKEKANTKLNKFKLALTVLMYRKVLGIDWDDMVIADIDDKYREYEGKTVLQAAKEEGLKPLDMYLKLVELSNREGSIYLGKYYNDEIVKRLMEDELSIFMSDAWVVDKGLQNIATFQTFPQFFVLAKRYNMPIEKIVRKMTGATVDRFKIKDRGYLKPGYKADITILDLDNITVNESKPDYTPTGIEYVYINGQSVIKNGQYYSNKAGEFILKK